MQNKTQRQTETNLWKHQDEAVQTFLSKKNGILEMATGTGKTRTAIRIMRQLLVLNKIRQVIIIAYGTDLLEQWYRELLCQFEDIGIYRWYGCNNEFARFQLCSERNAILLLNRDGERVKKCLKKLEQQNGKKRYRQQTMLVFDEIHGMGSEDFRRRTKGLILPYHYRLGLSATPVREYDKDGTEFIFREVGQIIYKFNLEDAIRKGILCEFSYEALYFELTEEEKRKKKKLIAYYEMSRKKGQLYTEEELYRDLARINKTAINKISLFEKYVTKHPEILERCIIFVETKEYGLAVQKMLLYYTYNFHTYYGEDDYQNLERFARKELECLITCKKISEGIDIKSVRNIVLFSSDRGEIVTTQRIGRSLRRDLNTPQKRACVVDFVCIQEEVQREDVITSDLKRETWLRALSKVRRVKDEII